MYALAWVEYGPGMPRVWLQRYDAQLTVGAPLWVSQDAPYRPAGNELGLVAISPGEYGIAFQMGIVTQHQLVRVSCTGP